MNVIFHGFLLKGFHVHTAAVTKKYPNCTAALAHFNPYGNQHKYIFHLFLCLTGKYLYSGTSHGPREADINNRHVGDLGNLVTDASGVININFSDSIIQFYNPTQNIAGRTVVIHQMSDDGGSTGTGTSSTTG